MELKNCPFCDHQARIDRDTFSDKHGVFLYVKCKGCGATSRHKYHSHGSDCPQKYEEVRQQWNTRAAPKVRKLEWQSDVPSVHSANTSAGRYGVFKGNGWHSDFEPHDSANRPKSFDNMYEGFDTVEEAKARAQAHHEALILSALEDFS